MKYKITITVEKKGRIHKDLRDSIIEDVPGAVQDAIDDIFDGCKVIGCEMEKIEVKSYQSKGDPNV